MAAISRRAFLRDTLWTVALPLLAACNQGIPPVASNPTPASAALARPTAASTLAAPTPSTRGRGETLRLLWWQAPTILNSHLAAGQKDFDAARPVLEPLAALDSSGSPVPILASQIPTLDNGGVAADLRSVTWKLKPNVKWSDGSDLSAADVVFTYSYMADAATAATDGRYARGVDRVEALDPLAVRVTWQEPNPYPYQLFTSLFGHILQKKQFENFTGAQAKDAPGNLKPIGTGPYKVREFKPGDVVIYDLNELYRDVNKPFFKEVQLKGGGDATSAARAALQTGEVDYAWNLQVEAQVLAQLTQGATGELITANGPMVERLIFNFSDPAREVDGQRSHAATPHPFLSDIQVRHALAMAVDRKAIAEQLYGPAGEATTNIVVAPSQYVSPNTVTFEHMALNLPRANQLLDAAGWHRGSDGTRAKDGVPMAILFQTTVNPLRQKTQEIIKAGWEQLGVRVELKAVAAGVFFSTDPANPDTVGHFYADVQMLTSGSLLPDWTGELAQFTTAELAQRTNEWRGSNNARYSSADYDRLWRNLKGETNPSQRSQLTVQLNDHLIREAVIVPLVARRTPVSAKSKRLQGTQPNPWDSELWNIADWTMTP